MDIFLLLLLFLLLLFYCCDGVYLLLFCLFGCCGGVYLLLVLYLLSLCSCCFVGVFCWVSVSVLWWCVFVVVSLVMFGYCGGVY